MKRPGGIILVSEVQIRPMNPPFLLTYIVLTIGLTVFFIYIFCLHKKRIFELSATIKYLYGIKSRS